MKRILNVKGKKKIKTKRTYFSPNNNNNNNKANINTYLYTENYEQKVSCSKTLLFEKNVQISKHFYVFWHFNGSYLAKKT